MARLVQYQDSQPSMDHFGDSLVRDPFHDAFDEDSRPTFTEGHTSGILPVEFPDSLNSHSQTEAQVLASQYGRPHSAGNQDVSESTLAYIDDADNYPRKSLPPINDHSEQSLVYNADVGRRGDLEYAEPEYSSAAEEKGTLAAMFTNSGRYPLEQRIEDKKRGIGRQKYPFVGKFSFISFQVWFAHYLQVWTLSVAMVAVFIYELVVQSRAQGSPISLKVRD